SGQSDGPVAITDELRGALADAECLLRYASEAGIDTPTTLVERILGARAAVERDTCTRKQVVTFYDAFAHLASQLKPVTAETIRASSSRAVQKSLERNRTWAIGLTVVIVLLSILTFIDTSITDKIASEITEANDAAARLTAKITGNEATNA